MRKRLFGRFYRRTDKKSSTQRHGCHPYSECIWHRAAHTEASSGCHRSRRLHLYRRLLIRHRRNHPNGKNIPSGIWCSSRHGCEARIAGSHPTRLAGSRHKGRPVTRHQPGYVYQMVVYLCNGRNGCLLRRSDGRSTETGKDTEYIYRTFYGKRCLRKETRRRISRRPSQLQPESD